MEKNIFASMIARAAAKTSEVNKSLYHITRISSGYIVNDINSKKAAMYDDNGLKTFLNGYFNNDEVYNSIKNSSNNVFTITEQSKEINQN